VKMRWRVGVRKGMGSESVVGRSAERKSARVEQTIRVVGAACW